MCWADKNQKGANQTGVVNTGLVLRQPNFDGYPYRNLLILMSDNISQPCRGGFQTRPYRRRRAGDGLGERVI